MSEMIELRGGTAGPYPIQMGYAESVSVVPPVLTREGLARDILLNRLDATADPYSVIVKDAVELADALLAELGKVREAP